MQQEQQQAQHPALQLPRPTTAGRDVRTELQRKEHELSHLRMAALRTLEQQLSDAQGQYQQLQLQFEELKGDFQYNLQLLAERDTELEQADAAASSAAADLAAKATTISQLQSQLAQAQSDVRVERQRSADAAAGYSHKCQQLQQQLDQERSNKAAALLEQQEQFQQQKHQLQALLAEAEDQLERQRRELSAGFLLQAQQIEAKHASAAADARAEAATAAALAEARAAEAVAAHEQVLERTRQAEAAQAQAQEAVAALNGLKAELQHTKQQAVEQQTRLEQQLAAVKQQLQRAATAKQVQEVELHDQITSLQQQLQDEQDKAAAAAAKQAAEHEQQLQELQERLQAAVSRAAVQHAGDVQAAGQLRARLQESDTQLAVMRAERDALQERLAAAVTETITAAEAAAVEAAQQIMSLQQDISRLQATNTALHQTLEEVHSAAASYKEQLAAAVDKERDLQRKLLQAQLMCEEQSQQLRVQQQAAKVAAAANAVQAQADVGSDAVLRQLQQQRDAATTALAEVQGKLRAQEAELQQLRQAQQQHAARADNDAAGQGDAVVRNGSTSKPPPLALDSLQQSAQQPNQQQPEQQPAAAEAEPSGSSWLEPDLQSNLPSPALAKLLATPGSGASFWLDSGPGAGEQQGQQPGSDDAAAAAAAAARDPYNNAETAAGGRGHLAPRQESGQGLMQHPRSARGSRHPLSLSADSALVGLGAVGAARGAGVAALAAQLLSREANNMGSISSSLEDAALMMLGSPRAGSRLQQHSQQPAQREHQQQPQVPQQMRELAAALVAAEATNQRQRAVISALRQEMEELQAAGLTASEDAGDGHQGEVAGVTPHSAMTAAVSAQVQLSVLRAELAASDAELQHLKDHLALVLQQLVAGAAGRAPAGGGQQPQALSELQFLRERVSTLLADNRKLRRQAMQLQLQAADDSHSGSLVPGADGSQPGQIACSQPEAPEAPPVGGPAGGQQQLAQDTAGDMAVADASSMKTAAAAAAAAAELSALQEALAAAEQHVGVLGDENERLMELSNGLRAENDGLKKALSMQGAGDRSGGLTGPWAAAAVPSEAVSKATALAWRAIGTAQQPPVGLPVHLPALCLPASHPRQWPQQQALQGFPASTTAQGQQGTSWAPLKQDWAAAWQQQQLMPAAAQQQWQQLQRAQQPPWLSQVAAGGMPPLPGGVQGPLEHHQQQPQAQPLQQQQPPVEAAALAGHSQATPLAEALTGRQHHQAQPAQQQQRQKVPDQPLELQVTPMQPARPSRQAAAQGSSGLPRSRPGSSSTTRTGNAGGGGGGGRGGGGGSSRPIGLSGPGPPAAAGAGSSVHDDAAIGSTNQQQQSQRLPQTQAGVGPHRVRPASTRQQGDSPGPVSGSSKQLRVRNYNIADDEQAAALVASPSSVAAARQSVLAQQTLHAAAES